jgi:hypothetical protein
MSIQIPKEFSYDDCLPVIVPENYVYDGPLHKDKDGIIVIDTEFKGKTVLTLQVSFISKRGDYLNYIVINNQYEKYIDYTKTNGIPICYSDFKNNDYALFDSLVFMTKKYQIYHKVFTKSKLSLALYFFYTLTDLNYALGIDNMMPYYLNTNKKNELKVNRNVKGTLKFHYDLYEGDVLFELKLYDLKGLGSGGLKDLANSCGLTKIDVLDSYKSDMDQALIHKQEDFFLYGMNDCILLPQIHARSIATFNSILVEKNIPLEAHFNENTMPLTVGSIVSCIWNLNLLYNVYKNDISIRLALTKMCILSNQSGFVEEAAEGLNYLRNYTSLNDLKKVPEERITELEKLLLKRTSSVYEAVQYASVPFLISESVHTTAQSLGFTTGGRTVNERPRECFLEHVADVDIKGAYGSQLIQLIYPIGRPRVTTFSYNQKNKTKLGAFMKKMLPKITSNLLKVSVSGKLSFDQDLILSKVKNVTKQYKINYEKYDPDDANVQVPFVLLRREIQNGFITPFLWEVLTKVCTTKELGEINELTVDSAIYWLDSDRANTIEELANSFLKDRGEYKFSTKLNTIVDNRTFKWYGYPVRNFIEPLIEKRGSLKKSKNPMDKALDTSIKLIVNTTWGLFTSIYFPMGNAVCSELVTSNIRTNIWLLSKALNTAQSITDGGAYQLSDVSFLKPNSKKPSLETFSSYYIYKDHPSIIRGNLGNINWKEIFDNNIAPTTTEFLSVDQLVTDHIVKFWSNYKIDFQVGIEHKPENFAARAVYFLKAHYWFKVYDPATNTYSADKYKKMISEIKNAP